MPNCDWFGTVRDHAPILEFLFQGGACEIYQSYSDLEKLLIRFNSPAEVLAEFRKTHADGPEVNTVHLQLRVSSCSPPFAIKRLSLDPKACSGATWRERAEGLGLIQLYLSAPEHGQLKCSHTNHNSQKRAAAWSAHIANDSEKAWDFEGIAQFSSKLNRRIRQAGIAKVGPKVVHPHAWELHRTEGLDLTSS